MLMPGQELRDIEVLRPVTRKTENGRAGLINRFENVGCLRGILAAAKPEEIERWRQLNHPISHKVITQGSPDFEIRPGFCFALRQVSGHRYFYNQTQPYNVGDLDHWIIFYCEERFDVGGVL